MTLPTELANFCIRCYNATQGDPLRGVASTQSRFRELLQRGYSSVSSADGGAATRFLEGVSAATWSELDTAASRFARQSGVDETARLGTRDFLGVSWRIGQLDRRIGGRGLGPRAPSPDLTTGFAQLGAAERSAAQELSHTWLQEALAAIDHADFARVADSVKVFYREQAAAAKRLYDAAVEDVRELPQAARHPYLSRLLANPSQIWQAYKVAIFPAQQQMAERLSMSILAGHNPYSDDAPPTSAIRSLLGTLWEGLSQLWR